jgi:hypothetical protein
MQGGQPRKAATNRRLAKVAVQCSADSFVVNKTLVLRINICGENRHFAKLQNVTTNAKKTDDTARQ